MKIVTTAYADLFMEIKACIKGIDAAKCKTKRSKEKTMSREILYSPVSLNNQFKKRLYSKKWEAVRVKCDYPTQFYTSDYRPKGLNKGAFREMDFVKRKLGVEVQFGKYSFMVYNVAAKMTIFKNLSFIDTGVEIVPVKALADDLGH